MKKFIRICTGGPFGDETSAYVIELPNEEISVAEFIDMVIRQEPNEWGAIRCGRVILADYSHGKITYRPEYETYKNRAIASVSAHGGWSLMDYNIVIHSDNPKILKQLKTLLTPMPGFKF